MVLSLENYKEEASRFLAFLFIIMPDKVHNYFWPIEPWKQPPPIHGFLPDKRRDRKNKKSSHEMEQLR